jgi:hypothetical protein
MRIVQKGLAEGDQIVVNGLQRARPGMKVTPTLAPMDTNSPAVVAESTAAGAR